MYWQATEDNGANSLGLVADGDISAAKICLYLLLSAPDKILKISVTSARSKVKPRSHHDFEHLHTPTNVRIYKT